MTHPIIQQPDPALDLVFERVVDIPKELVSAAWTTPEHVKKWFTPARGRRSSRVRRLAVGKPAVPE
jgi:uncharacterized protein YndB with AHSA1/START domain